MEFLILLSITVGVLFLSAMWRGYVLSVLWGWFIVPVFHLPVLSIATAIGLCLIITFLTHQPNSKDDSEDSAWDSFTSSIRIAFLGPLMALFAGWILTFFL